MIRDISLLLNKSAHGVQKSHGRADAIEKLKEVAASKSEHYRPGLKTDDAVELRLSSKYLHERIKQSENPRVLYNRLKEVHNASGTRHSAFEPGQNFHGPYRNGEFVTNTGFKGSYELLTSGGHIGFRLDGYSGILQPDGTAYAVDPKTGEAYTMKVEYGGGKYEVTGVREMELGTFEPGDRKPLLVEGQENLKLEYDDNGNISAKVLTPDGKVIEGTGYMDGKGNMIVGLSTGETFHGHYAFDAEGRLNIYR